MEADGSVWLWVLSIISMLVAYWYLFRPSNLPPGSAGLPIFGYLPFLGKEAHLSLKKLGSKYGNIYHLYLGSRLVVILNDYNAIREAFIKNPEIFAGRPEDASFKESPEDNLGLIANDGEYWKQHRRFILSNLRDYGVGKLALEPLLLNEIQHFLEVIKKKNGESFPIKRPLNSSIANNIHILVTGKRYDYDHPLMEDLFKQMKLAETTIPALNLVIFFPWITKLPGSEFITKRNLIRKIIIDVLQLVKEIIQTVKNEYKEGQQENYVHAFMNERNARLRVNDNEEIFTELGLIHNTRDLLIAGTDTTTSMIHWSLLYMILNPEIQIKVQKEIDRVIGREREPSYNDRTNMPYTEATIMELHRIISLAPLSVPHRTTKDVVIFGHRIPKDTMIMPNLWAVHHDPNIWGDQENFRPERFIGLDGQVMKSEHVIPFSIGKRACVGEPLARMELFLYFVSLLQHFNFVPPDGVMPNLETLPGFVRRPKFQLITAILRER